MPLGLAEAAAAVLDAAAGALADPPSERGVVLAAPALDCELLTVHLGALDMLAPEEGPLAPLAMRPRVTMATFVVTLAECVTSGEQVAVAETQVDALRILGHAEQIWWALAAHDFGGCKPYSLGSALPLLESGGFAGVLIPVRLLVERT